VTRAAPLSFAAWVLLLAASSEAADSYVRAAVDEAGALRVVTRAGQALVFHKEPEQIDFDQIVVSPDSLSVGWLALYPNCCTSYPIPLKLVVYSAGKLRKYSGSELPVWRWRFLARGKQVAFEQETVHGGLGAHYELRDVRTGRLIGEYTPATGADSLPGPNSNTPEWVAELDAKP
jgi:hypothetical protein